MRRSAQAWAAGCLLLVPLVPFQRYTLANGLTVILAPDHNVPTVTVDVTYHVGSQNERPGRTGFAHLFEHVMFTGSGHVPYGLQDRLTEGVGGLADAMTHYDRTSFFETVPSNYLEDALWLESDRMGFLLDSLTQAKLDNQRDVVKNERRQHVDNQPYGRNTELIDAALYPPDYPYRWPILGSMADLSVASLDDVRQFFRRWYGPENATLTIVGDFDPRQATAWIARYFGDLPRESAPATRFVVAPVTLAATRRLTYQDRVPSPQLTLTWPTVGESSPDRAALEILGDVLAVERTSRLTAKLVYERGAAAEVIAVEHANESAGEFAITMTPTPGHTLTELEAAADSVIDRLRRDGPTVDEVRRTTAERVFFNIRNLESTMGRARALSTGQVFHEDPDFLTKDVERMRALTPRDVQRVAEQYLSHPRVVLSVVPLGELRAASHPDESTEVGAQDSRPLDRTVIPPAGPAPLFHPPVWTESTLANGARLEVLERRGLPLVAMAIHFEGGADQFEPLGKHGVARLTARAMNDGTTARSGDDLSVALARLGAEFGTTIGAEDGAIRLVVLREHLAAALGIVADELLHPTFPVAAVARRKSLAVVALRQQALTGSYLDSSAFAHLVYGPRHPYGWVTDSAVIASLTRDDLAAFHAAYFQPARAVITVVGDIDVASARRLLDTALAGWRPGGEPVSYAYPSLAPGRPTTIYLMDRPGAAQSSILIGLPGPPRSTPDYYALEVLNKIVGGLFQSRINHIIREEKGWTYRVTSMFAYGHGPGPFTTGGDVVTAKTDSAILIFLRELRGVQGGRSFTDDEIAEAKAALIQSLPARFATVDGTGAAIGQLYTDDLPRDYYAQYASRVQAVTSTDLLRVANQYLDLAHLAIVVAGDRAAIGAPLDALGVGPVVPLDAEYRPAAE